MWFTVNNRALGTYLIPKKRKQFPLIKLPFTLLHQRQFLTCVLSQIIDMSVLTSNKCI